MGDIERPAWLDGREHRNKSIGQKGKERIRAHVVILDLARGALVIHVIRRIGPAHIDQLVTD